MQQEVILEVTGQNYSLIKTHQTKSGCGFGTGHTQIRGGVDMEVDEALPSSVLTSTPSSVSVSLHPLVVMNISDHFTRLRMQQQDSSGPPKSMFPNRAHHTVTFNIITTKKKSLWSAAWSPGRQKHRDM